MKNSDLGFVEWTPFGHHIDPQRGLALSKRALQIYVFGVSQVPETCKLQTP